MFKTARYLLQIIRSTFCQNEKKKQKLIWKLKLIIYWLFGLLSEKQIISLYFFSCINFLLSFFGIIKSLYFLTGTIFCRINFCIIYSTIETPNEFIIFKKEVFALKQHIGKKKLNFYRKKVVMPPQFLFVKQKKNKQKKIIFLKLFER